MPTSAAILAEPTNRIPYIHICVYAYTSISLSLYIYIYIYTHIFQRGVEWVEIISTHSTPLYILHICVYIYIYIYTYTCTHLSLSLYIYIYVHIYIYIYTEPPPGAAWRASVSMLSLLDLVSSQRDCRVGAPSRTIGLMLAAVPCLQSEEGSYAMERYLVSHTRPLQ